MVLFAAIYPTVFIVFSVFIRCKRCVAYVLLMPNQIYSSKNKKLNIDLYRYIQLDKRKASKRKLY